jgi:hypothetical protein
MVPPDKGNNLRRLSTWRRFVERLLPTKDSYRPELHYMRGPGPKCREKQVPAFAGSATHRNDAMSSMFMISTDSFR